MGLVENALNRMSEKMKATRGQPLTIQKWRVMRARKRGFLIRQLRCRIGWHNPPHNQVFEVYGSVMVGGACSNCSDGSLREVTYIGDAWDFLDATTSEESAGCSHTTIHTRTLEERALAHMHQIGCFI